jgi:hypothetical protein
VRPEVEEPRETKISLPLALFIALLVALVVRALG